MSHGYSCDTSNTSVTLSSESPAQSGATGSGGRSDATTLRARLPRRLGRRLLQENALSDSLADLLGSRSKLMLMYVRRDKKHLICVAVSHTHYRLHGLWSCVFWLSWLSVAWWNVVVLWSCVEMRSSHLNVH